MSIYRSTTSHWDIDMVNMVCSHNLLDVTFRVELNEEGFLIFKDIPPGYRHVPIDQDDFIKAYADFLIEKDLLERVD